MDCNGRLSGCYAYSATMKIEVNAGSKRYGRNVVFENQSLCIPSGSLVAVLGDNGQGKSTLIECIYGLQEMNEGELLWDGKPFDRHDIEMRKRAFYMPDLPPFNMQLDGLSELAKWFSIWGVKDGEGQGVEACLDRLELFNVMEQAGRTLNKLSRGELYKVALSGFLSLGVDLWILDEPLASGMDTKGIEAFKACSWEALKRGVTIIYTTQLEELAQEFSTNICRVEGVNVFIEGVK